MTEQKMQIDPAIERQEDQAMLVFLRQRCAFLAQSLAIHQRLYATASADIEALQKELQELKESIMTGGNNG